jgi:hypothetical protein
MGQFRSKGKYHLSNWQKVLGKNITGEKSDIDLSRLINGIYFLTITTENNYQTIKMIKKY